MSRTATIKGVEPPRSDPRISVPEIWDVRRTIELRTAELAAVTRTDEEAAEILALAEAIGREAGDVDTVTGRVDVSKQSPLWPLPAEPKVEQR